MMLKQRTVKRLFRLGLMLSLLLAITSWLLYVPFLKGWLPGLYPLASLYSQLLTPLGSMIVVVTFLTTPLVLSFVLLLGGLLLYSRRPIFGRWLRATSLWLLLPLLSVSLLPMVFSLIPVQHLAIEPWGQVYHVAYSSLWLEDNDLGNTMLFECGSTGLVCRNVYELYTFSGAPHKVELDYDTQRDRLTQILHHYR